MDADLDESIIPRTGRIKDGDRLMDARLKRTPGLYIAGFMCSGKSTVGKRLADHVGWDFVDVDAEIERAEQTTIAAIFDSRGESEFRRVETEALRKLVRQIERGMPAVL